MPSLLVTRQTKSILILFSFWRIFAFTEKLLLVRNLLIGTSQLMSQHLYENTVGQFYYLFLIKSFKAEKNVLKTVHVSPRLLRKGNQYFKRFLFIYFLQKSTIEKDRKDEKRKQNTMSRCDLSSRKNCTLRWTLIQIKPW